MGTLLLFLFFLHQTLAKWKKKPPELSIFANMTDEEKKMHLGKISKPDLKVLNESSLGRRTLYVPSDYPESFDIRDKWNCLHEIQYQGICGSCWAFSSAETVSTSLCVRNNGFYEFLSPQYLLSCETTSFGCDGGYDEIAMEYIMEYGIVTEDCFPYISGDTAEETLCPTECSNSSLPFVKYKADTECIYGYNEGWIKHAIYTYGAVSTSFTVYTDFYDYDSGIYQPQTYFQDGGHAVEAIGWGVDEEEGLYWIVANSWGTNWGDQGFFKIKDRSSSFMYGYTCAATIQDSKYDSCPSRCRDCNSNSEGQCYLCKYFQDYLLVESYTFTIGDCVDKCSYRYSAEGSICYRDDKCPPGYRMKNSMDKECIEYKCSEDSSCYSCASDDNSCISCNAGLILVANDESQCTPFSFTDDTIENCCVSMCSELDHIYLDLNSNECKACHSSCVNCKGPGESNCIFPCHEDKYFLHSSSSDTEIGSCLDECPLGTVAENGICISIITECHTSCASCLGDSANDCLSCSNSEYFVQIQVKGATYGSCVEECSTNTYLSNSNTCSFCSSSCSTCINDETFGCTSCNDGLILNITSSTTSSGSCIDNCPEGFYENNGLCSSCYSTCSSCQTDGSNDCFSCKNDYYLQKQNSLDEIGECLSTCNNGFYGNSENICERCDSSCLTCIGVGENLCTSCEENWVLNIVSESRESGFCTENNCADNYYLNEDGVTCTNIEYNCLKDDNCAFCYGSHICSFCYYYYNLLITKENSYYCDPRELDGISISSCCLSSCSEIQGTYEDPIYYECLFCNSVCKECRGSGTNNCTECNSGYLLKADESSSEDYGSCVSSCPIGMEPDLEGICQISCDSSCSSCVGYSSQNCTSCSDESEYLVISNYTVFSGYCHSQCPQNSIMNETAKTCIYCYSGCISCSGNAEDECLTCDEGLYLNILHSETQTGSCKDSCLPNYQLQQENSNICISNYNCYEDQDCSSCWDDDSCHYCINNLFLETTSFEEDKYPICTPSETFDGNCCHESCQELPGYYKYSNYRFCLPCAKNCLTCNFEFESQCTSCNDGYYLETYGNRFKSGYCKACHSSCQTCINSTSNDCLLCNNGNKLEILNYSISTGACIEECNSGYYELNGECFKCNDSCKQCVNDSYSCTECSEGYIMNLNSSSSSGGQCSQDCLYNYTLSESDNVCYPKYNCFSDSECSSCQDVFTCSECSSGYLLITSFSANSTIYFCNPLEKGYEHCCFSECPSQSYLNSDSNCESCDSSCLACSGSSSSQCTKCNNTFNFYSEDDSAEGKCLSTCPDGFIASEGICQKIRCDSSCLTCTGNGENNCLTCEESKYLVLSMNSSEGSCEESCPINSYVAYSNICGYCDSSCTKCSGNSSENCTECPSNTILNLRSASSTQGICLEECKGGFQLSQSKNVCLPVYSCYDDQNCKTCSSEIACKECEESFSMLVTGANECEPFSFRSGAITSCCFEDCSEVENTFTDSYSSNCYSCDQNCSSCSNSELCLSCSSELMLYVTNELSNNGLCLTQCPTGFNNLNGICEIVCDSSCEECVFSGPQNCSSCPANSFLHIVNEELGTGECKNSCPEGYSNNSGICEECHSSCQSCTNSSKISCTDCRSSAPYLNIINTTQNSGLCLTACLNQFKLIDSENKICSPDYSCYMDEKCSKCGNYTTCLGCNSPYGLVVTYIDWWSFICDMSIFPEETEIDECCLSTNVSHSGVYLSQYFLKFFFCDEKCKSCQDSDVCLSCYEDGNYPYFNKYDDRYSIGVCESECLEGFVLQSNNSKTCVPSNYECTSDSNCGECEDYVSCKTCSNGLKLIQTSTSQNICIPHNIYYLNLTECCISDCSEVEGLFNQGESCGICDSSCKSCVNKESDGCTECYSGYVLYYTSSSSGSCISKCPKGFTPQNSICEKCDSSCKTCIDTSDEGCLSCNDDAAILQILQENGFSGKCEISQILDDYEFQDIDVNISSNQTNETSSDEETSDEPIYIEFDTYLTFNFSISEDLHYWLSFSLAVVITFNGQLDISEQVEGIESSSNVLDLEIPTSILPESCPFFILIVAELQSMENRELQDSTKKKAIKSQLGPYESVESSQMLQETNSEESSSFLLYIIIGIIILVASAIGTVIFLYCRRKNKPPPKKISQQQIPTIEENVPNLHSPGFPITTEVPVPDISPNPIEEEPEFKDKNNSNLGLDDIQVQIAKQQKNNPQTLQ